MDAGGVLVRACERRGVLVDLSDLTEVGFWGMAKIATRPLVASNSNVDAISPSTRNLTGRQLVELREPAGLVVLSFQVGYLREDYDSCHDTPTITMLHHFEHLGEDGVALDSDFDACEPPKEIGDFTGPPRLITAMRQSGYGGRLIAKIARVNWLAAPDRALA